MTDRDEAKWKFVKYVVMWSVIAAVMGVVLFPTMSNLAKTELRKELLWIGACVIAIPAFVSLAYGFTGNLYVGVGALIGFPVATVIYLKSVGGACMALAAFIILLRGAWLLFRAEQARRAVSPSPVPPPPPPAPSPAP